MFGIPLGAAVSDKFGIRTPLYLAMGICVLNCLLITFALPAAPPVNNESNKSYVNNSSSSSSSSSSSISKLQVLTVSEKLRRVKWRDANPFGAAVMLTRSRRLLVGGLAYFLVNLTQSGVQVVWVNYLQYRYGLSAALAGATLMLVGLFVAVVPAISM